MGNFSFILLLALALASHAPAANALTGSVVAPSGTESLMRYQATVRLPDSILFNQANMAKLIHEQTKHLVGSLSAPEYAKLLKMKPNADLGLVALGDVQSFQVVARVAVAGGTEVTYRAVQKVLAARRLLGPGEAKRIPLFFPHDPTRFYAKECTDTTYPEKEYLFYYWNPFAEPCHSLLTGRNQVDQVVAEVKGLDLPPASASPRYAQLASQIQARGELHIALLFGFNESSSKAADDGRKNYENVRDQLLRAGFEKDRFRNTPTGPFVELVRAASPGKPPTRVSLSLSMSDIGSPVVFARRAREAFETADIVVYEGHSGLGGNLDLDNLTRLSSPDRAHPVPIRFPNLYQIFFFDSCDSYYYYTGAYALEARGARNLDVVSNGLSSYFDGGHSDSMDLIRFFLAPSPSVTWLDILSAMEKPLPGYTYLINVAPIRVAPIQR